MRSSKRGRNSSPAPPRTDVPQTPPVGSATQTVITQSEEFWQGPLPHPHTLDQFRQIVPDAPQRIFDQWEQESAHRRAYEMKALDGALQRDRRGQFFAISFALGSLMLSGVAVLFDQPWVAAVIGGGTIGTVVGAFLYQRQKPK